MTVLILGLALFLGAHSVRIFADAWRTAQLALLGERMWKALYSVAAAIGFVLIIWGYHLAQSQPVVIWSPPQWLRLVGALLTIPAFVLLAGGGIAVLFRYGAVVLFGAFLVWGIADFRSSRRRDRAAGTHYPGGTTARDTVAVVIGLVAWALFAFLLHPWLIGVQPLA